jgi:tetratricopeptide (TPR) repeat protein
LLAALALCLMLGATGGWVLLHPGSLWLQPWRAERSSSSPHLIFGPYPLAADFVALKHSGVTTIVSLLDPDLPYERILLAQERTLAARHGIRVLNFPMASILGQSFGKDYVANSRAAADAALRSPGVVYIHCYLGLHRAKYVRQFLAASAPTTSYAGSAGAERPQDVQTLDRANIAFLQGHYHDTLRELAAIPDKTYQATLLQSWAHYRLGHLDDAARGFAEVARTRPDNRDALSGLGYSALQSGDLAGAERHFKFALSTHPDDIAAVEGLGYVRYRQGRGGEAVALLQRVVDQVPGNTDARDILRRLQATPATDDSATNAPGAADTRDLQP